MKENKLFFWLSLACALAVITMIVTLCIPKKIEQKPFVPPAFDVNAGIGEPIVPDNLGYSIIYRDGMSFSVGICGKINITNNYADVYFTNISDNDVWLKVRLYDRSGHILGESGLIRPDEYLISVTLNHTPDTADGITVKIMSYEPETYKSLGAITLTPQVTIID